jgi:hypothetical protein
MIEQAESSSDPRDDGPGNEVRATWTSEQEARDKSMHAHAMRAADARRHLRCCRYVAVTVVATTRWFLGAAMAIVLLPDSASAGVPSRQLPVVVGDRAVSRTELRRAYRRDISVFGAKAFRRLLRETHQSRADVRVRAYRDEYAFRVRQFATAGVPDDQRNAALDAFAAGYRAYWQPLTRCTPGFFVADICSGSA